MTAAVLSVAFYIWSIKAEAADLEKRVVRLEQIAIDVADLSGKIAAIDYKVDFLVRIEGKPTK